jgi:hypothetical protein
VTHEGDLIFWSVCERYRIEADRLLNTTERAGKVFLDWPLHIAGKPWTSLYDFRPAFTLAVRRWLKLNMGEAMLHRVWPTACAQIEQAFAYAEATP